MNSNAVVAIVPILQQLSRQLTQSHQERVCGVCGCLLVWTDPSCPNCRLTLIGTP